MRIEQLGEGTPEVAVVAGIHGDDRAVRERSSDSFWRNRRWNER